jgi:hypothetical protein
MAVKLGIKCKVYRNTSAFTTPSWSENKRISDATYTETPDEGSADDRGSRVHQTEPTMYAVECSGKMRVDPDDAEYVAFRDAHAQDLGLDLLILDGANTVVGSEGSRGWFKVFGWSEAQELTTVLYRDFVLKPCVPQDASVTPVQKAIIETGPTLTTYNFGEDQTP